MNTRVWLIRYKDQHGQAQAVAHSHNSIADYRASVDPAATVDSIDVAAIPALIEEARKLVAGVGDLADLRTALMQVQAGVE